MTGFIRPGDTLAGSEVYSTENEALEANEMELIVASPAMAYRNNWDLIFGSKLRAPTKQEQWDEFERLIRQRLGNDADLSPWTALGCLARDVFEHGFGVQELAKDMLASVLVRTAEGVDLRLV